MNDLVPLPIVLPLLAAGVSQALNRYPRIQRPLGVSVLLATAIVSGLLLGDVREGGVTVSRVGGHDATVGIVLAVDTFSAIMLVVSSLLLLAVLVYAVGSPRTRDQAPFFHPVYLVLAAGVSASFLTSDLFNLFVAFEVMLMASYVLMTLGGTRDQVRHGMTYVVISLLASTLFITAVGLVYAATGTVNMAQLAEILPELPLGVRSMLGAVLLVVFGVKAAIFPLFSWLPDSYPTAPSPVTAIFAGLLTKVGVYAIIRTQTLLFPTDGSASVILIVVAGLTMTVGVLGAIAQNDIKRILSFHIVSQIGYMVMGLALFTVAGLAAAIFFLVHQIVVKTTLFLVFGLVEHATGTGQLKRLGGLRHSSPLLAALFLLSALSLAGIPPLSGFVAKLALVQAGLAIDAGHIVAVALGASLLTLFSMAKIWAGTFWGRPDEPGPIPVAPGEKLSLPAFMVGPTVLLVVISLGFVVVAEPILSIAEHAAVSLLEPAGYIQEVLGP